MPSTIVSLPESTGLTILGNEVFKSYGLDAAGYQLQAAPPSTWIGTFKTKLSSRALTHLSNIRLSIAAITEMDKSMNVEKISARQAAERWIAANPHQVDNWRPQ